MAKNSGKTKAQKRTPSSKRAGAGSRAAARSGAGAKRAKAGRNTGRKTAGARTPKGKAKRKAATPVRRAAQKSSVKKTKNAKSAKRTRKATRAAKAAPARRRTAASATRNASSRSARKKTASRPSAAARPRREGGTGRESDLDQTPETGRSVKGPTNPFPTKRSTGTAAGAGGTRQAPGLERARRHLREVDETVPSPPSSLKIDRHGSAARTGRQEMREARREHTEVSPEITAGDVDADWASAYDVGDEAPGGDNPTPDQNLVEDIGRAVGVEYEDNEELKASDKIAARDKKRWELDPASSDDYQDRD